MENMINILGQNVTNGISVISAVRNREANLLVALKSWLQFQEIDEIIIVDWTSKVPLIINRDDVKIFRVEQEDKWCLSKAFNLAATLSSRNKICKLDADYVLKKDFFKQHVLKDGIFYTGNYRTARDANEMCLNGFFYSYRKDFLNAGGFHEDMMVYGWADCDLYLRLQGLGLLKTDIDCDFIEHLEHSDESRGAVDTDKDIAENKSIAANKPWSANIKMSRFHMIQESKNYYTCYRTKI